MPRDDDAGIEFMEECSVTCNLCGEHVGKALHLCVGDGPPKYASLCINLCTVCLKAINHKMPPGWTD